MVVISRQRVNLKWSYQGLFILEIETHITGTDLHKQKRLKPDILLSFTYSDCSKSKHNNNTLGSIICSFVRLFVRALLVHSFAFSPVRSFFSKVLLNIKCYIKIYITRRNIIIKCYNDKYQIQKRIGGSYLPRWSNVSFLLGYKVTDTTL